MKRFVAPFVISACFSLATGCSGHLVHLKGERLEPAVTHIPKGSRVFVVEKNQLILPEKGVYLKSRVLNYLESRGFSSGDHRTADYYLVLGYSLHEGRDVREKVQVVINFSGYADVSGNPASPPPTVQPVNPSPFSMNNVRSMYETRVSAKLIDGRAYRETGIMKTLWSGKAWASVNYPGKYDEAVTLMVPVVLDMLNDNVEKETIVRERLIKKGAGF